MTDLQEKAMRMALEFCEHIHRCIGIGAATIHWDSATWHQGDATIGALSTALAQPEQEPVLAGSLSVRYFRGDKAMTDTYFEYLGDLSEGDYTLYTAPPKREWAGLTDEEIDKTEWEPSYGNPMTLAEGLQLFARTIEAKLKEKNT